MKTKVLIGILIGIIVIAGSGFAIWYSQIPRCPESCDDGSPCTKDFCSSKTNYQCEYSPIVGLIEGCKNLVETCKQYQCVESECQIVSLANCCGNEKCETGEDWETCPQDCELCDDGDPCTEDIYSYKSGLCSYIKLTGPQPGCSAKVTCGSWSCRAGVCQIEYISNCCENKTCEVEETYETCSTDCPNCDDKNECTIDEYDYHLQKCVNAPILDVVCCGNTVCETGETYEKCAKDCPNCDDDNECTNDSYDYHQQKCINEIIIPCCGNEICDEDVEKYSSCPTDCPDCDDNNELTADSFNYETQECEHMVTHYFIDDFEEGVLNWNFQNLEGKSTTTWGAIAENGNTALSGKDHNWATYWEEWTDYIFKVRFKRVKGGLHVNFRHTSDEKGWNRYFVSLWQGTNIELQKQLGPSESIQTLKNVSFAFDKNWHTFEIRGYNNILNVYIDNKLLIKYKDTKDPILSGAVTFETLDDSEFLVDDVEIKVITEEDVVYP